MEEGRERVMMESEADFRVGFWFGVMLANSMGFKCDRTAVYDQLRALARGDLTLMPSREEAFRNLETTVGRPLTEEERELAQSWHPQDRAQQDAQNSELASLILRLMGQQP